MGRSIQSCDKMSTWQNTPNATVKVEKSNRIRKPNKMTKYELIFFWGGGRNFNFTSTYKAITACVLVLIIRLNKTTL